VVDVHPTGICAEAKKAFALGGEVLLFSRASCVADEKRRHGACQAGPAPARRAPAVRYGAWHDDGMTRIRLSTTVDATLLEHARGIRSGVTNAALVDEALAALLARHRAADVDASYAAYDEHPLDEPDEWGDLASFRRAAAAS